MSWSSTDLPISTVCADTTVCKKMTVMTPTHRIAVLIITVLLSLLAVLPIPYSAPSDSLAHWMTQIADDTPLCRLSIPGTHDSGARYSIADVAGKCQTLSIADQLEIGVRFFDIRLQLVGDRLRIVHSFVDQKQTFDEVLSDMLAFLEAHPGEVLLVSLKQDSDPQNARRPFSQVLEETLLTHSDRICTDRSLPKTLGEARGKMYIFARYADAAVGLDCYHGWADNATFLGVDGLFVQDTYAPPDIAFKYEEIEAALQLAYDFAPLMTLNFASCYLPDSVPPVYAGIPARTINPWLIDTLSEQTAPIGVLLCDFMTEALARAIIEVNDR